MGWVPCSGVEVSKLVSQTVFHVVSLVLTGCPTLMALCQTIINLANSSIGEIINLFLYIVYKNIVSTFNSFLNFILYKKNIQKMSLKKYMISHLAVKINYTLSKSINFNTSH